MTLEQMRALKQKLERDIVHLCRDFETLTGLDIMSIELVSVEVVPAEHDIVDAKVEVRL